MNWKEEIKVSFVNISVLLPHSALNEIAMMNVSWPILFKIYNPVENTSTHCGVMEFIAEEGTCFMPYWMMNNLKLQEGQMVKIENVSIPKGTYVKLKPQNPDFAEISNPKVVLEKSLRHFATLTAGDRIRIEYNDKCYDILIDELKPANAVSIIETDITVDIDTPDIASVQSDNDNRGFAADATVDAKPWKKAIKNGVRTQRVKLGNKVLQSTFSGKGQKLKP